MNNRYIFRGKREDNGEWIYGNLIKRKIWSSDFYVIRVEDNGFDSYVEYEVISETVEQCSGVPDKNGKLMFEGDVVNALFDFEMPIKSVCVFKDGSFGLLAKQHGVEHFHPFTSLFNIKYEVIGNIHDNNLLEVKR